MISQATLPPFMCAGSHDARSSVQVIGFPRKTSESVVYQLSGTEFQGWNVVSVQRLLGERVGGVGLLVNADLFFQPGGMDLEGGFEDSPSQNTSQSTACQMQEWPRVLRHLAWPHDLYQGANVRLL